MLRMSGRIKRVGHKVSLAAVGLSMVAGQFGFLGSTASALGSPVQQIFADGAVTISGFPADTTYVYGHAFRLFGVTSSGDVYVDQDTVPATGSAVQVPGISGAVKAYGSPSAGFALKAD